jgi:NAD-dependent SIR2 family protein deacetylase
MDRDTEDFVDKYLKELRENNAAVFVGAGMSRAAGYVDWQGLMSPIASGLGLDAAKEADLVALAQYHLNANATNRHQLNQLLIDEFSDLKEPTENHALLARLPIHTYWTTNYDRLIESALEAGGRRVDAKYTNEQLAITRRGRDAVVYKMHGDIEHPDKAVPPAYCDIRIEGIFRDTIVSEHEGAKLSFAQVCHLDDGNDLQAK